MAMNKKEKLYVEELEAALLLTKAVKTTQAVLPDIPPPEPFTKVLSKGWVFNSYSRYVTRACSSSISHARNSDDKTSSQGSIHLYSTELLATKAMRYELEQRVFKELSVVDARITDLEESS